MMMMTMMMMMMMMMMMVMMMMMILPEEVLQVDRWPSSKGTQEPGYRHQRWQCQCHHF